MWQISFSRFPIVQNEIEYPCDNWQEWELLRHIIRIQTFFFPSDRSIGVVTYEIFFPFTMQDQQQQLQMIWLNDHRAINENLEKKGRIIFNSPLSHDSAL